MQNREVRRDQDIEKSLSFAEVRVQDRVAARLRPITVSDVYSDARVWALNPFGIELIPSITCASLEIGSRVQVDLVLYGQRSKFEGVVTNHAKNTAGEVVLTIRFVYSDETESADRAERKAARWLCSDKFLPVGVAPSPAYFDDWMYFQVRDISSHGMQLTTSLRNKYLLPGTTLRLNLMFPVSGNVVVEFKIRRVGVMAVGSVDMLLLGGEFVSLDSKCRTVIGQYLVQFAPKVTLDSIRDAGLLPKNLFRGVSIRYAKSHDDYQQVLALRFEANRVSGQLDQAHSVQDMIESDDAKSRILLAVRGDEAVATVRIRFPGLEDQLEAERHLKWPDHLPRRENMFEVSRLAINAAYRGKDVLPSLFHYISLSAIGADRPWITMSAMEKYVPFYRKVGFQETGLTYRDARWSNELHVLVAHAMEVIRGRGVHPIYWYVMWSKVLENFERDGIVVLSGMDRFRTRLFKVIGSLSSIVR